MDSVTTQFEKYGLMWNKGTDPLHIEFYMIRSGGVFARSGRTVGMGLFHHYKAAQKLLWPDDDDHRWSDLALKTMIESEITVFMGCGDSNKTYSMSRFALVDWWVFAGDTLWLISSTEYRGAELRIWGTIKNLFNRARDRYPNLAGHVLESMHAITTDEIDDERERARSLQRGMILVPCKKGTTFVGLSSFVGVKAPRLRHAGDEVQHMAAGFLDAYSNWYGKRDFKGIMSGNPTDPSDSLCVAAEPPEGWEHFVDTGKTQTWSSRFFNASVIAFDGRDSPNNDFPGDTPKYHYLINRKKLDGVAKTFGTDSWQWYNQCVGKPNKLLAEKRIITKRLCEQHRALEKAIWIGSTHTWVYGLDPAYGGGDRCVGFPLEFGEDFDGRQIIKIHPPELFIVNVMMDREPEQQIAEQVKDRLTQWGIPVENCFWDSFGRGTLGYAFARVFGSSTPIPIDSGARPTTKPVRFDLYITDASGVRRLMRSDEYYSKRISEMWYSVREAIEGEQIRELPRSTMDEGCLRIFDIVQGNKVEVESKKDMKDRTGGKSPDEFDALAIAVEGARQRGFRITRLGIEKASESDTNWLDEESAEQEREIAELMLRHE